jgi:diguanylate cyclase (GGDEF)-like protein/putative nucleotidyltransferase with HDIG domain
VPASRRARRPVVLLLVYGIFLVLIGVTAAALTTLVSQHFTTSILNSIVGNDAATVRTYVNGNMTAADLTDAPDATRVATQTEQLTALATRGEILHVEIRDPAGRVLFSDSAEAVGAETTASPSFAKALTGQPVADFDVPAAAAEVAGPTLKTPSVLREYLPILTGGSVKAVFAVWRDAGPILARLDETRRDVLIVTLSAGLIAAFLLFLVFRGAQGRITRQTQQLLEATRRDALTDMLNHGAMVEALVTSIEQARTANGNVTVALVDIDNFRLLNDTYGHTAGDTALTTVGQLLASKLPKEVTVGRYGPDEFLLISPPSAAATLEPALQLVTAGLVDISLRFGATERLPITVSAGIAAFPDHADSATALLSTAAYTLAEAKNSGGNAVRVANARIEESQNQTTFDVYQGLIIAVDTKDRYTKRHSEDVARYAMFLADRIGLDADTRQTLRLSALLHDVGKIGIPDNVLRKPGVLTADERAVIEQHVALGDAIVRNLPNVDTIRAGIRHHHERWDGKGYLDRLAGEEIPFIARLISVGDLFSAMTTSRPYRKALGVDEALRRLEDAAGTQLDERLVAAFVEGIRTDPHPPLPGEEVAPGRLWTPARAVA